MQRQERKVVTVLFCDLVGFTSRAEEMDPEDVAALLGPYHSRLKEELERHGGTVEKFIGDAVMALFGAPIAHEDDPERAVRAALAIRDFAIREGIELRIGITTGEALIDADASPQAGETMATGDVVNTAARLQAAAPVNGALVSKKTYAATSDAITYENAEPVEAKGKAKPVPVWRAVAAAPVAERAHTMPLVGRERELELLRAALARARDDNATQLLTLVGAPGIGKSRLVHELARGDGGFSWRKGRCLPYGDGVTFWALGEVVKTHLGILESDAADEAERKLLAAVDDEWIADNLRPLVGLSEVGQSGTDRRAEAFAAWREFVSKLAQERPLAIVLEDLHWADEALLDFVTYLFEWARESPLLLLCTARPELLDRRPGWGTTEPRALTIPLAPLSDEETSELLFAAVDARPTTELLERAGGNPLYAEQYARLVLEHGSVEEPPATVQGIIAARLDGLPGEEKALVQDTAVIGRVFWSGAVAALVGGGHRWSVEERLLALERREVVRRERLSSIAGETQYAFRHILLRDVAYGQIPRGIRGEKHRLAAGWIEALGRPEEQSEMLAHHYLAALELAAAAGKDTASLAAQARVALRDAGDRALGLDASSAAARFYQRALELWPPDDPDRPLLLFQYGRAIYPLNEGTDVLEEARGGLLARGDIDRAAEAEAMLGQLVRLAGRRDEASVHFARAAALAEGRPVSASIAFVLWYLARMAMFANEDAKAIEVGRQALAMAEELGLTQLMVGALSVIGPARVRLGDLEGVQDLERAIEIAETARSSEAIRAYGNLGSTMADLGDFRRARDLYDKATEVAERFGHLGGSRFHRGNRIDMLFCSGEWHESLEECERFLSEVEAGSPHYMEAVVRLARARIKVARGDVAGALADAKLGLRLGREAREPQVLHSVLAEAARVFLESGQRHEADTTADELVAVGPEPSNVVTFAIVLGELGRGEDARATVERDPLHTVWVDAARAYLEGDLARTADLLAEIGHLSDEAYVRLRAAERLVGEGRRAEADEQLERALAFYRSVGATRYIQEAEALLAATA